MISYFRWCSPSFGGIYFYSCFSSFSHSVFIMSSLWQQFWSITCLKYISIAHTHKTHNFAGYSFAGCTFECHFFLYFEDIIFMLDPGLLGKLLLSFLIFVTCGNLYFLSEGFGIVSLKIIINFTIISLAMYFHFLSCFTFIRHF